MFEELVSERVETYEVVGGRPKIQLRSRARRATTRSPSGNTSPLGPSTPSGGGPSETDLPAESDAAAAQTWLSSSNEDPLRSRLDQAEAGKGSSPARTVDAQQVRRERGGHDLPRSIRIRSSRDYLAASKTGRRIAGRDFVLIARRSVSWSFDRSGVSTRLGITASRRVGNAVARNRVKRHVREWFRKLVRDEVADWIVIARPGSSERCGAEVARELDELVGRLGQSARNLT